MHTGLIEPARATRVDAAPRNRSWVSIHFEHIAVAAVLILFSLMGIWYSLVVPPFETPDEINHYAFARHLSLGNGLPIQTIEKNGPWEHEGTQPPLYYFLVSRLISGIDQSDFDQLNQVNPHANMGDPLYPGNKNRMLYSARPLPLRGTNLAMHIGRWFSLFLACLTLLFVYGIARMVFPLSRTLPIWAVVIVAAIPQFDFISATVSNDNMVIVVSTATIFWLGRMLTKFRSTKITRLDLLILGMLLGLAALSKLQGLGLIPLSALVIAGIAWRQRDRRFLIESLVLFAVPVLLIAGWWYWRNHVLYGEWLGVNQLLTINGLRYTPQTLGNLWGELRGVRYSFWGLFGWFSILLPTFVYPVLDIVTVVALTGAAGALIKARGKQSIGFLDEPIIQVQLLLFTWAAVLIGLLIYWLTFATSGQGRLLFPAISSVGVFFASGLDFWSQKLPRRLRAVVFSMVPLGLVLCSIYALTVLLPQSYAATPPIQSVPADAEPVNLLYDDKIELVAVKIEKGRFRPGDRVPVTLYLRAIDKLTKDYPLFVQLLNQDNQEVGNVTSHPGWGRNPTTLWQPGKIYADTYTIAVWDNISNRSPLLARLYVGFVDPETHLRLRTPADIDPGLPGFLVDAVEIESAQPLDPNSLYLQPTDIVFGDSIRLAGYGTSSTVRMGQRRRVAVTLLWAANGSPQRDYTAFVHLIDRAGNQVSGFDQPPAEGRFPTSHWKAGDYSLSRFDLELPPDLEAGTYEIWAGLYSDVEGAARLPVLESNRPVKDNRIQLGSVEVSP